MTSDETFRYDPTPMNHAFPGQPDDCFDMVNQYGTYNIQKTADTDNPYPAIAQGLPKVAIFPGLEQDRSTVNRANSMEPRKITGEVLMVVMPASNRVERKTTGTKTAPMP